MFELLLAIIYLCAGLAGLLAIVGAILNERNK
jgi:hypothetical protein